MSFDRRRPRTAAEEEVAAGVGIGICNSGGSRRAIISSEFQISKNAEKEQFLPSERCRCTRNI